MIYSFPLLRESVKTPVPAEIAVFCLLFSSFDLSLRVFKEVLNLASQVFGFDSAQELVQ